MHSAAVHTGYSGAWRQSQQRKRTWSRDTYSLKWAAAAGQGPGDVPEDAAGHMILRVHQRHQKGEGAQGDAVYVAGDAAQQILAVAGHMILRVHKRYQKREGAQGDAVEVAVHAAQQILAAHAALQGSPVLLEVRAVGVVELMLR